MRKQIISVVTVVFCVILLVTSAGASESRDCERKIIIFDSKIQAKKQDPIVAKYGRVVKHLDIINATVAMLPAKARERLAKEPGILRIEDDLDVSTCESQIDVNPEQALPWGIDRVDADLVWTVSTGYGVKIAVIDSGIDLDHPDLAANIKGGFNTINHKKTADDDYGHGTHVAGIISASNNSIGVVGSAYNAELYAIKTLDSMGHGKISNVIEAIQWCVENHMHIANMSIEVRSYSKSFHEAIKKASISGLIMVAAAGNNGPGLNTINYPAKFDEVVSVAATDENDMIASFSSRGPEVDVAAPGVSIYSTYLNSAYAYLHGTSMAAPHVSGAIALKLQQNPGLTPQQVVSALKQTSNRIPNVASDEQGAGIIDAFKLISTTQNP
ncbi:MAG: peptidase S8 [Candidatus Aquicultor secundus]|uniref:Peptidase S8 n=1 Tax=Candidatus Aquicultor secundus TaxID=1973895 RepID=A0A2M7T7J1_9ACTN|nr:S8 family peptidase [Candidatus Aquicultor secundus]NCO66822.1 S8 family peptidase [Solirubrobacter sp.]OIO85477.1 MAG: hypothetical protein AUK32_07160 [Candidatus Aquicultor secundus]PIU27723.1 MAG: peptidase S8 [Candidatus Aquicultor secundus]PIW21732.1 MAG: peptidase S8 [Candidatus Aquicultor secundus]PIX52434.1 MAG: peptidase S8 [Candidatus Aquicultor secundus]